jgi:hypothetical protein
MAEHAIITSHVKLTGADIDLVAKTASAALYPDHSGDVNLSVKDISGNSGARTYLCSREGAPMCIVKVQSGGGIMDSHPNTFARVTAAAETMREHGIAPPIIMKGQDFHVEGAAGISVMQDYFHFDPELASPSALAKLLAKIHALPIEWYAELNERFLQRDPALASIFNQAPDYAPCWCLPWSGLDTGMVLLGAGNPNPETAKRLLELQVESGVYEEVMLNEAFYPVSEAARRQAVIHNDFKPDNILHDPKTETITAIDYDVVQVGPAVMDFGLPYMMWLGSRFTTFEFRQTFIRAYLEASGLSSADADVRAMMLDCEVNTIVAFPGLLAHLYDAEVPLLRGVKHPTAKVGVEASGPDASPTGLEIVDLLAEAVGKVRADEALIDRCLQEGLVCTLFNEEGFGSGPLNSWLKEMQKNRMLRLFGIAEQDGAELYVASHAK